MKQIIFIDRDGVINVDPIGDYIKTPEQFQFEPHAIEGLKKIRELGLDIILISNQAGVGDGVFTEEALQAVHEHMVRKLDHAGIQLRGVQYCLHGKQAGCDCRKPKTGLFRKAVKNLSYDPSKTFFIGDKATDIEAGRNFGIKTIFVRTGHGKADESKLGPGNMPDHRAEHLLDAADFLTRIYQTS